MVKIIDKILSYTGSDPFFSLEFFPPKTEAGVEGLYLRMDRMTALQPMFVDVTWGAGGSTKQLTMAICEYAQKYFGVDVLLHLSCTGLTVEELKRILQDARDTGIHNILALRGDPPKGSPHWEAATGGLKHAKELVQLIRAEHGDYFGIAVAGFPEGHPYRKRTASAAATAASGNTAADEEEKKLELQHLKEKVDAGADFIITQFFYDSAVFIDFQQECIAVGITCPMIPGMMPIQSFASFQKMTSFCKTRVPQQVWDQLEAVKNDDEKVKKYGEQLCLAMCKQLQQHQHQQQQQQQQQQQKTMPCVGFHFYTLNLEKSVMNILDELGSSRSAASRRQFPWRGSRSSNLNGLAEEVRPINWANRPKAYVNRTSTWDEFPNGRWGDHNSPAFGELSDSHFFRPVEGTKQELLTMWGEAPITVLDIYETFARYLEGRIPMLPWCESTALNAETLPLTAQLAAMNRAGFLTINSQPAVNGEKSSHPVYGWGGELGRVYQKAYTEFFTTPAMLQSIIQLLKADPSLNFYAINSAGEEYSSGVASVTALTWGVFPNKEILQPTVFAHDSFIVWSKEVFQLWTKCWAALYSDDSESSALLHEIHDTYFLVAIIDNDYVDSKLFKIFDSLVEQSKQDNRTARVADIASAGDATWF